LETNLLISFVSISVEGIENILKVALIQQKIINSISTGDKLSNSLKSNKSNKTLKGLN